MRDDREGIIDVMRPDAHDAARLLGRMLRVARRCGLPPARATRGIGAAVRGRTLDRLLERLARRLADSPTPEHRDVAAALAAAVGARDHATALALVTTAGCRTDLRAEKMVSRPPPASSGSATPRSPRAASSPRFARRTPGPSCSAAAPSARCSRARPEARGYFTFAFIRHPFDRTRSCHADKHALALRDRRAARWFIEPWHGLRLGMTFAEFCRWLDTPWGSDAFADRHWLSQHRQIRAADGRLPDFLGRWERLDADWRAVTARLGLPCRELPRLNAGPRGARAAGPPDDAAAAALRRRYAEDFRIGGYDGDFGVGGHEEGPDDGGPGGPPEPASRAPARPRAAHGRD